ncbi:MAG: hypothetical protein ACJAX4_003119 [Clostridium sp.]|jgi:hypothetical protein
MSEINLLYIVGTINTIESEDLLKRGIQDSNWI